MSIHLARQANDEAIATAATAMSTGNLVLVAAANPPAVENVSRNNAIGVT